MNAAAVEARIRALEEKVEEMSALLNRVHQSIIHLLKAELIRLGL